MIAYGHPPREVWDYTPFQATSFVKLAEQRRRRERAQLLEVHAMAVRSEAKDINRKIRTDWID